MRWLGFCGIGVVFFFFLVSPGEALILISEVMYDPGQCADTVCEWVELYNNGTENVSLSGCQFQGKNLSGILGGEKFVVIARNPGNFTLFFGVVETLLSSSFSLPNSGDLLTLTGNCQDNFNYTRFTSFANGNNRSLERRADGSWDENLVAGGTAGQQNSIWELSADYADIEITEFLPDPFGEDSAVQPQGEWVEVHNRGRKSIDLRRLVLTDQEQANELFIADTTSPGGTILCPDCYLVVYRNGDTDFALNNAGYDEVHLFTALNKAITNVSYTSSMEGMSWSKVKGQWFQTTPTPGKENQYAERCDWSLALQTDGSLFTSQNFSFTIQVERFTGFARPITVQGVIEDQFGNQVEKYMPWTNDIIVTTARKSYSPNLKAGIYQLRFFFQNTTCSESNPQNDQVSTSFAINPFYRQNQSTIYLGSLRSPVRWGEIVAVPLNIYKGKESKQVLTLWAEKQGKKISPILKIKVINEFQNYNLSVPVELDSNCADEFTDGLATIVVKGLDREAVGEFKVEGKETRGCPSSSSSASSTTKRSLPTFQILDLPASVLAGDALRLQVQIQNPDDQEHTFALSAYTFRGNKCYSCSNSSVEREAKVERVKLGKNEVKVQDLLLKLDSAMDAGEYKLKVKVWKDNQKTPKELMHDLYIQQPEAVQSRNAGQEIAVLSGNEKSAAESSLQAKVTPLANTGKGIVVYETNSGKAQKVVPYVLLTALGLLVVVIWQRK